MESTIRWKNTKDGSLVLKAYAQSFSMKNHMTNQDQGWLIIPQHKKFKTEISIWKHWLA